MNKIKCKNCSKIFKDYLSNHRTCCSRKCYYETKIGFVPWNKGIPMSQKAKLKSSKSLKGRVSPNKGKFGIYVGENSHRWKGEKVGYGPLHFWVRKIKGKANKCSINITHKSKRFQWGNISGKYKRDINDWYELCASCNKLDGIKIHKRFLV